MNPSVPFRPALALALALSGLAGGCGKPPPPQGGGGDMPIQAVVAPVKRQTLEEKTSLVSSLAAEEQVTVISEIDGRVIEVGFAEGGAVEKDQILFRIDDTKLKAMRDEAQARFEVAESNIRRAETLRQNGTISQQEYDTASSAHLAARAALDLVVDQLADSVIRAPFAGRTAERLVSPGQYVTRGQPLTTLVQTDPLKAEFNVPERFLGELKVGQRIELTSIAYPGERFAGEVYFVSPRVEERSRTVLVKARVPNRDGKLRPGMYGNLELIFRARENALVIPESAVSLRGETATVVVRGEDGKAAIRPVKTGTRVADAVEVLEGLQEGEQVVAEGFQKLRPGGTVLISPRSERYGIQPPPPEQPASAATNAPSAKQG